MAHLVYAFSLAISSFSCEVFLRLHKGLTAEHYVLMPQTLSQRSSR